MNTQLIGLMWLASAIVCCLIGFFVGVSIGASNAISKLGIWMIANGYREALEDYEASLKPVDPPRPKPKTGYLRYVVVSLGDSYFVADNQNGCIVSGPGGRGNHDRTAQQKIADQLNNQ